MVSKWKDHATGEGGDAADFVAFAYSLSVEEGVRRLIEMAAVLPRPNEQADPRNFVRLARGDAAEREDKARRVGRSSDEPAQKEIKAIAELRGLLRRGCLPCDGARLAMVRRISERGKRGFVRIAGAGTRKLDGWTVNLGRASAIRRRGRCPGVKQPGR